MNDLVDAATVEDRLTRTLAVRAEDMAPGDGQSHDDRGIILLPEADSRTASRGLWVAVAAAAVVAIAGAGIALVQDDGSGAVVSQEPVTSEAPPPTTLAEEPPPETTEPASETTTLAEIPAFIGRFENTATDQNYSVTWYPGWTADNVAPGAEPVTLDDGRSAFFGSLVPEAGDLWQLWIIEPDGVVELQASNVDREELIAAGNQIRRLDPTTFEATPLPGFESAQ